MTNWVKKLRKEGLFITPDNYLDLEYSMTGKLKRIGEKDEGRHGIIFQMGDKILKVDKIIKNNAGKSKYYIKKEKEFQQEVRIQKIVYECTKNWFSSLTPKVFDSGRNWILMKNVPGKTIYDWYLEDRYGVFQKAMRAYIKTLQEIHRKCGIGHFDAHGGNAMYDKKTNSIKIIDWGFAAPINKNNVTKESMLKKYKEVLTNKLGSGWQRSEVEWVTSMKKHPIGQYAIEVIPYNARFKNLKPKENIFDFMTLILSKVNNFPTPAPMTRAEFLKSLFTPTPSPKKISSNSTK